MSIQVSSQGINYIPTRAQQQSLNAPLQPKVASNLFPIAPIRITAKKSIPQMLLKAIYQNDPQFGEYFNAHPILFNLLDTAVSKQDKSKILAQFLETTMIDQPTVNKLYSIVNDIKWGPVIGSKFLFDGESSNTLDNVNDVLGRDVYSDLAHKGLFVKDPKELINRTLSREDVLKLMNRGLTQAQVTNLFINSLPHTNPEIIRQTVGQIFTEEQPVQEVPVEGLGGPETLVPGGQPVPLNPLGPVSPQTTSVENPPQGPVVASAPDSTMVPNKILESLTNAISSLNSRMASLETPVPLTVTGPFGEDFSKELEPQPAFVESYVQSGKPYDTFDDLFESPDERDARLGRDKIIETRPSDMILETPPSDMILETSPSDMILETPQPGPAAQSSDESSDSKPIKRKRKRSARGRGLSNDGLRPVDKFIKDARFKVTKRDSVNQEDLDQRQSKVQTKSAKELLSDLASYTDFPTNVVRRNFGRHFSIKNMPKLLEDYVRDNGDDMKQFNEDLKELRRYLSDNTK